MQEMKGQPLIARLVATRTVPHGRWVRGRIAEVSDGFVTLALCGDVMPEPTGELILVEKNTPAQDGWRFFADDQLWQQAWEKLHGREFTDAEMVGADEDLTRRSKAA